MTNGLAAAAGVAGGAFFFCLMDVDVESPFLSLPLALALPRIKKQNEGKVPVQGQEQEQEQKLFRFFFPLFYRPSHIALFSLARVCAILIRI